MNLLHNFNRKTIFFLIFILATGNIMAQTQSPGLDVLGFGYDVFGNYADQKSKKSYCLFNYSNFTITPIGTSKYSVPQNVILENISNHIVSAISGESVREYTKNLAVKAGLEVDAMFFSGSVNSSYSKETSGSERTFFFTYMDANTKWRISLDTRDMTSLFSMLEPQFKKDLYTMEPRKLFATYGTHFIARAYLGGRADYTSVSQITNNVTTTDISLAVSAKYGSVSGDTALTSQQKEVLTNSKTKTDLHVTGGNSQYANNIKDPVNYKLWADGIENRPVLCDFDSESLQPLWILCEDSDRVLALKNEFEKICEEKPLPRYMGISSEPQLLISKLPANLTLQIKGGEVSRGGSSLELGNLTNDQTQQFYIEETEKKGEYKIRTKGGLYITPQNPEDRAGLEIIQNKEDAWLIWLKENAGDGYFRLRNKKTGYYITVEDNKNFNNMRIMQNTKNEIDGQKWKQISKDKIFGVIKTVFQADWSAGWTTTKIVDIKNTQYLLHYKRKTGTAKNSVFIENGDSVILKDAYQDKWTEGWTSLEPFKHNGTTYHLSMKSGNGEVHVDKYNYAGKPDNIFSDKWSNGWTHFEIIYVGDQPYFLHYKKATGLARIGQLNPNPGDNVWEGQWEKNIAAFQYYRIGKKDYLFILSLEGRGWIFEITRSGKELSLKHSWSTSNWETNITSALVMDYATGPILFLYKNQTGKVWYMPLYSDGTPGRVLYSPTWSTGWTDFDSWNAGGMVYFFHHKESGQTKLNRINW